MTTIAKFTFNNSGSSVYFYNKDLVDLMELEYGLSLKGITRKSFVSKVIPLFVYCGASIVTILEEAEKSIYAYEIQVANIDDFSEKSIALINQFYAAQSEV